MAKQNNISNSSKEKYLKSAFLSKVVTNEIEGVLLHYNRDQKVELTEHLIKLFEELAEYAKTNDVLLLQQFTNREVELLKKYRSAYKPYEARKFFSLFDFKNVLLDKNYFTEEKFNALPIKEKTLGEQDVITFCNYMENVLTEKLYCIYLEEDVANNTSGTPLKEENDTNMTEARRLLAIHYLFKATLGTDYRSRTDTSVYARFAHLLLGKKITKLQDSSIYKKYKKLPNYNTGKQLILDLQYIKPFFEALDMQKAVDTIEKEIETETKELNT